VQETSLQPSPRKRGRPRKVDLAVDAAGEHWADKLVRLYSEGGSDTEVCKEMKMSHRQFVKRERDDILFAELVEYGRLASKAWWLEVGRKYVRQGAPAQAFNFWYANMKNRFGWSDKAEAVDQLKAESMSTDEITAKIAGIKNKIAKFPANAEMRILGDD